jgi:protein-tyrosine phosphatase
MNYLNLPILDLTPPTHQELDAAVAFMQAHCDNGVYLHCALGVSRSVCVLAAFLISAHHARNVDEAFELIRARRPVARLHPRARKVLEEWCLACACETSRARRVLPQ